MRTKLLLVVFCLGAALLPSPASAAKKACTQEEFMTQSLEYTPEIWRLTLEFDMACMRLGASLELEGELSRAGVPTNGGLGFSSACVPVQPVRKGSQRTCEFTYELEHEPVERSTYDIEFTLQGSGGRGAGITGGSGEGSWTCTSAAVTASCE